MCYDIIQTKKFRDDLVYYIKKKKFKHIDDDIDSVIVNLEKGILVGKDIDDIKISSGNHTYKVRVANSDTNVGKSNGYRLIYYVVMDDKEIYLLTIYYKKDDKNIPTKDEIASLIKEYCL